MNDIIIDFSQSTGPVKALHGVNNSPATFGQPIDSFREAGIPYVRLHDTMGAYGGTVFVDVPNIFPDFSADENDPASYQFEFTDAYLAGLTASGCQIFYRLGPPAPGCPTPADAFRRGIPFPSVFPFRAGPGASGNTVP
ncbi:MAG: hypothetical protein IKS52_13410, partial [Clostridia bacterium]|nr:hypothetical protein [Clostridia bacterium]